MLFAYLPEQSKKLIQTLADNIGIAADLHKIRVAVPSWDNMNMQMTWHACSAAPSKIHPDVKTVWLYRKSQGLLCLPDEQNGFRQLLVRRCIEIWNVPDGRY